MRRKTNHFSFSNAPAAIGFCIFLFVSSHNVFSAQTQNGVVGQADPAKAQAIQKNSMGQQRVVTQGGWITQVAPNREFDFGDVQIGTSPAHEFEIKNTTESKFQIDSIRCSCGCVKATFEEKSIEPGESAMVTVTAKTDLFRGPKTSTIHARFKDPTKEIVFSVALNIRNVAFDPDFVDFRSMDPKSPVEQTLFVDRAGFLDWKISKIETTHDLISAEIVQRIVEENEIRYEILCKLAETKSDMRPHQEIKISSNDSHQPLVTIPVRVGNLPIQISHDIMVFEPEEKEVKQKLIIKTMADTRLTRLNVDSEYFTATEISPGKKKVHIVEVVCIPKDKIKLDESDFQTELKIMTNIGFSKSVTLEFADSVKQAENK